jgi:phosphoribosylformylglycinamidine (FGAM) synthase PurS component
MKFDVKITVGLKEGMLDPETTTIRNAIRNLGAGQRARNDAPPGACL